VSVIWNILEADAEIFSMVRHAYIFP